ncbi:TolC family protein [Nannocystis pusilla]|uniref:TolC family protein n=1 Tax=Nannocystis pusilla TaxID=889268 RepID=UPI003DA21E35
MIVLEKLLIAAIVATPASSTGPSLAAEVTAERSILLDERKVLELAVDAHPSLEAARETWEAARSAAKSVALARAPSLDVSANYTRLSSLPAKYRTFEGLVFPQILDNLGMRIQLAVPILDMFLGLAAAARAAGHDAEGARLEAEATRAQVVYDARVAFLDFWSRKLALGNAVELHRAALSNAEDQRRKEMAGTVAKNDVLPFETALDQAVMAVETAKADAAVAEATLRAYLPMLEGVALAVPSLPPPTEFAAAPEPAQAPTTTPKLLAIDRTIRSATEQAKEARWSRLPQISAFGVFDLSAPSPRVFIRDRLVAIPTWEAGIRIEWRLAQLTQGSARLAEREHRVRALRARLVETRRKLHAERTGAISTLMAAHARLLKSADRVGHAQALVEARRVELTAGTALPLNVISAEVDLVRARNEHVSAFIERALASARLDLVDGRTKPNEIGRNR